MVITSKVNVQELPAGILTPDILKLLAPEVAVMTPPQLDDASGVGAIIIPEGKLSIKDKLVKETQLDGLSTCI